MVKRTELAPMSTLNIHLQEIESQLDGIVMKCILAQKEIIIDIDRPVLNQRFRKIDRREMEQHMRISEINSIDKILTRIIISHEIS